MHAQGFIYYYSIFCSQQYLMARSKVFFLNLKSQCLIYLLKEIRMISQLVILIKFSAYISVVIFLMGFFLPAM